MSQQDQKSAKSKHAKIALAVLLFLTPVLNEAAIAPISDMTPAQVHHEFSVTIEAHKELSLADFRNPSIQYNPKNEVLDLQEMARIGMAMQKQYAFDASTIIPTDMPAKSSDQTYIANKVLQHALEYWYANSASRQSEFVRTADTIGNGLNGKIGEGAASHFAVKVRPASGEAQIRYDGLAKAEISYDAFNKESKFEVSREISGKQFVFNTIGNQEGVVNQVGVRWNF